MDDQTLIQQVINGDSSAFGRLVKAHQARLIRFAYPILGDHDAAQDAVQETFLRLWRARDRYTPDGCLQAYLLKTARNICLDHLRKEHPASPLDDHMEAAEASLPEQAANTATLAEAVRNAVLSLSTPQREVFVLSHYEGLSYREIAEALDCPINTVASRKHLAVEELRRRLQSWTEEE